jgi:hypothetical protein
MELFERRFGNIFRNFYYWISCEDEEVRTAEKNMLVSKTGR